MSTPMNEHAAGAREAARQDNGQFGTQAKAEVDVDLVTAAPKGCFGCDHVHVEDQDGRCWEVDCQPGCPACADAAAERDATTAAHQANEARLDAQYADDDEAQAKDYMTFMDPGAPPEPETFTCAECGEYLIADPDGSPGVLVHIDEDGNRDHDADEDHTGVDEDQVEDVFGTNVAYPNGRCQGCGFGLDTAGLCYQHDCSRFDAGSALAENGSTTSGEEVHVVLVSELALGDRLLEGTVTSIDNDHKTTSIELDDDPETIAEYANDETVTRYVPDFDEQKHCWECHEDGYISTASKRDDNGGLCDGCYDRRAEDGLLDDDSEDDEDRECGDDCVEHASWCDGYCTHTEAHRNACLDVPAAEQPLTSANRDHRPHPDLADEDVKEAYRA